MTQITKSHVFNFLDENLPEDQSDAVKALVDVMLDASGVDSGEDGEDLEAEDLLADEDEVSARRAAPARGRASKAEVEEDDGLGILSDDSEDEDGVVEDEEDDGLVADEDEPEEAPAPARGRRAAPAKPAPAKATRVAPARVAAPAAAPSYPKKVTFKSFGINREGLKSAAGELEGLNLKQVKQLVSDETGGIELGGTRRDDVVAQATQVLAALDALDAETPKTLAARLKAAGVNLPDLRGARTAADQRPILLGELVYEAINNS